MKNRKQILFSCCTKENINLLFRVCISLDSCYEALVYGNLRVYSSKRGSGTVSSTWVAVEDQCEVFGYCGHNGVCSYNDSSSSPICGCPSQNFEMVNPSDSRKGCRRKVRLDDSFDMVVIIAGGGVCV